MTGLNLDRPSLLRWGCVGAASLVLLLSVGLPSFRGEAQPRKAVPVRIIGTLFVAVAGDVPRSKSTRIEVPDTKIVLLDGRGDRVADGVTELDGKFALDAPGAGSYRVCYELRSARTCSKTIRVDAVSGWAGEVAVTRQPTVHGRVLTGDGRPCWVADSFFNLDVSTRVVATPAQSPPNVRPLASVRANTQGEYALFGLRSGTYTVTATCEAAAATGRAALRAGSVRRDLRFANRAPAIRAAAAFEGQRGRTRALVGKSLDIRAQAIDPDGDTIQYLWSAEPHAGQLTPGNAGAALWRLPPEPGLRHAYLIARDGKGGYAYSRVDMEVARDDRIDVSGRVVDETNALPVHGAVVTVGAARTQTDQNGWFSLRSDAGSRDDDERYVVNIHHPAYALASRIIYRSARGATYELTPAQISRFSAGEAIRIADRSSAGFCGRQGNARPRQAVRRVDRRVIEAGPTARYGPAAERLLAQIKEQDAACVTQGAEIVLPADALVYSRGAAPSGSIRAAVTTLNPSRRALPGEYRALTRGGSEAGLLSFGAVDARFSDSEGRPLNLRPGASAEVRIPVPPSQMRAVQPVIALWSYDEKRGIWLEEGEAKLERSGNSAFYVGRTRHFSTINIDIPGITVANATCVRVMLHSDFSAWTNLRLRAYVSYGGTSSQVGEAVLDTATYHGILTLPYNVPPSFPPNLLRLELLGTFAGVDQVLLDNVINTDLRPKMLGSQLFPQPPFDECGVPILLAPTSQVMPPYEIDATNRPIFLTGPNGTFNPAVPQTAAYYAAIDPGGLKTTLGGWWAQNGFTNTGQNAGLAGFSDFQRSSYMNHNDLGLGRDMHCLRHGGDLACYVTNYGLPDQNDANADDADTQNVVTQGATVTMEFKAGAGAEAVQFYVYGGGTQFALRAGVADLDGFGPKPVPYLCSVCHGGNGLNGNNKVANAKFREFDPPTFRYPGGRSWDFNALPGPTVATAAQLQPLGTLNRLVRDIHPGTLIGILIDGWYPGNSFANLPVQPPVPGTWSNTAAYNDVYAPSCRTCHIARGFSMNSSASFGTTYVGGKVCGNSTPRLRKMPNAVVTYKNFWASSTRVSMFEALTGVPNCGGT